MPQKVLLLSGNSGRKHITMVNGKRLLYGQVRAYLEVFLKKGVSIAIDGGTV